jgi:prepilin-type N-terminal cleavage/methylation domain-containing protein
VGASPETRAQRDRGFTLLELLVVIIVIGIIAAIAVPMFLSQRDKAAASITKQNMRNVVPVIHLARENTGKTLEGVTEYGCSDCACQNLANPLPVKDPGFGSTSCGIRWWNVVTKVAAAAGEPTSTMENEGGYSACGTPSDRLASGGKDHILMGAESDDITWKVLASGFC